MNREALEDYIDRPITVHFMERHKNYPAEKEGVLQDITAYGILLDEDHDTLLFIPYSSIRMVEIKPKPTLWQKLTGTY